MDAIEQYLEKRRKSRYSESTIRNHRNILNNASRFIRERFDKALIRARTRDLEHYLEQCGSVTTRRTKRSVLKGFFDLNQDIRHGQDAINFEELKVLVRERDRDPIPAPTPAKVIAIQQIVGVNPLHRLLFAFLIETGMRVGSCVAIKHEDLVLDINRVQLNRAKGGKVLRLKMPESLLTLYKSTFPSPDERSGRIFHFSENRALKIINQLGSRVGIRLSPHALRKYFACMVYYETKDLLAVQRALNHSNAVTTSNYLNRDFEEFEIRMDMMERGVA